MNKLDKLLAEYAEHKRAARVFEEQMKKLRAEIDEVVLATGDTGNVEGVQVSIREAYARTAWDGKKLEGYAVAHPEILDFAKEILYKRAVSIKVS